MAKGRLNFWIQPGGPSRSIIELHGGGFYTFQTVTEILGTALGKEVTYRPVPLEDAHIGMVANGMSASFADALIETAASFNREERWALEAPSWQNTTRTTFEQWAAESFTPSIPA